jgi:hypothetical protein
MQTGMHRWLLNNQEACMFFDFLFYSAPFFFLIHYKYNPEKSSAAAITMLLINLCYIQCYTLYPSNSIEGHIAWLLFPVVFIPNNNSTFQLLFEGLRFFFLFFFVSSGIWKIVNGGVFNLSQMSGILLEQHKELLVNSIDYWQTKLFEWLIKNQVISYGLYLIATLMELSFIIGFFSRRYDKLLAVIFIMFLIGDYLIMRIPYFEVMPLLLTLYLPRPRIILTY